MFRYTSSHTMHRQSSSVGQLLRRWRTSRQMSQMALASEAEVSTRHISFIENGKAKPSRDMVLVLASVLDVPLRERNAILLAAGYAPVYRETSLDAPDMVSVKKTLELMLRQAEPFGAIVLDSRWNLLMSNEAATRTTTLLADDAAAVLADGPPNLLRLLFHPAGIRGAIANWEDVARATIGRAHREAHVEGAPGLPEILEQVWRYPGVPRELRSLDLTSDPPILIPIHFRRGPFEARVLSTVTTLGTAQDITLQELRIEVFYPADEDSERVLRSLAEAH